MTLGTTTLQRPARHRARRPTGRLQPGWPLVVIFAGMPLWWVLGLVQLIFFAMSVPMLVYLLRKRTLQVPQGMGMWFLFLVWLLSGLFVLQVDAPGAVPGESMTRYLTFGYRFGWYLIGTIALLYVANTRGFLKTQRIVRALAWMFVALVAGGLLGLVLPTLSFPSFLELALPSGIANNGFVNSLIHAQTAQIQDFLGYVEPRPSAPFAYSNEWGLNLALTAPFFVAAWWKTSGWSRAILPIGLALAAVPVISSLNRGLWLALIMILLYVVVRSALHGRIMALLALVSVLVVSGVVIAASPLGDLIQDRLNTPHSNEGRASLSTLSVQSTLEGSPIIGFGTTRDVEGNFSSIGGGATDQCPRCSPPPLGTQGQLWLILFGSGLGGLMLYIGFFTGQFLRHLGDASRSALAAQCSLIALLVTMPVYNSVGAAIFVSLTAVGILIREGRHLGDRTLTDLVDLARRNVALVGVAASVGGAGGAVVQYVTPREVSATQAVLISEADVLGIPDVRRLSIDSEGALATSQDVLESVGLATSSTDLRQVRSRLTITAEPNTRILNLTYADTDRAVASAGAEAAAAAYLDLRADMAQEAARDQLALLHARQESLLDQYALANSTAEAAGGAANPQLVDTATQLRSESRAAFGLAASLQSADPVGGQLVHGVQVVRSWDPWMIKVGSGIALGVLVGLILAWFTDGRFDRLGRRLESRLGLDLPTVATTSRTSLDEASPEALTGVTRAVGAYLPLCGILPDPASPGAVRLTHILEQIPRGPSDRRGTRVLLVASTRSRSRPIRRLHRSSRRSGLDPVGMILLEE